MQQFFVFLASPAMRVVGKCQLILALSVYFYCAWSSGTVVNVGSLDWLMHFIGNALLYGSFWWAFFYKRISWQLLFILLPFSLAIELGQYLIPSRSVSFTDMLANVGGLSIAFLIGRWLQKFIPN